jgi:threonine dehydratase
VSVVLPARSDVEAAAAKIHGRVRRTPVVELDGAEVGSRGRLVLKLELLQHAGSFKARGALNNVLSLPQGAESVAAASGGNHGAAVAWAATNAGLRADVFVPETSTPAKLARIEEYGATPHRVAGHVGDALEACAAFSEAHGVPVIHPYDTFETVCGAATLGLELLDQVPGIDQVVVACGGGGLYTGIANALADSGRMVPVQPVEPELCPHLHAAQEAGNPVFHESAGIAADALGPPAIGRFAFATAQRLGASSLLVPESAIVEARAFLWHRLRVLAEPAAAVPLAAVIAGMVSVEPRQTVALVVSGGNNATLP